MDLSRVIAISGKPGLYRLVSQTRNGFIVEDLDKGKKVSIAANYNVSLLENVAIYGVSQEYPLAEVFFRIYKKENGGASIDHKSSGAELRAYMEQVLPEYDDTRVYDSDLKKLFQWYNILQSKGLLNIDLAAVEAAIAAQQAEIEAAKAPVEVEAKVETEEVVEAKPKKKAAPKKAKAETGEEKPAKKTAAKKTTKKKTEE
ncbi:DUF5606 family protein [Faecalibacter rhinopitheci]|uniref:DUF5606 domain-containing protein n=1 Tax=Faecalibacter rhinopitheci TaxID=2779678 RepID=A0A8J7G8C2_9FLAO|nr:DUF5606 domain-containing protein [Faecalibacter rhinopitheci]MBF0597170.1 DUF5606 domain-containing protein [Faecalibacter rhinopitheci]MBQ0147214.1 DUF5606 domain-containing protein [Candidatus Onthonaster equi]